MQTSLASAAIAAFLTTCLSAQGGALTAPCYVSQLGTALGAGDDTVAPNNALGFTFPGPAGPVTSIDISSNGFVWLGSNSNSGCCGAYVPGFLTDTPRIAVMWSDLYPPGFGDVYFNTFPAGGGQLASAVITWYDVPEYTTSNVQTMQLQLFSDGSFSIVYDQRVGNLYHDALIGVTQGVAASPNAIDFSAVTQSSPHLSGTNPTVYELQSQVWDLAGKGYAFIPNGQGGYIVLDRPGCALAGVTAYGHGCPSPVACYELFANPTLIDLSNTAIEFTPTGSGYVAVPSTGFFTGYTNANAFGDDDVQGPFTLPFTFPFPGGSTNVIDISSNGFVWLSTGNSDSRCCNGDPFAFLADPASIAPLWMDLYPPGGGSIYFDTTPTEAHITWANVPEFFNGAPQTAQLTLRANGTFRLAYQTVANNQHDVLVGFSQGAVPVDPGSSDFSAGPVIVNGGGSALGLASQIGSRPVIGTSYQMDLDQSTNGALIGLLVLGTAGFNPGIDLTAIGMAGCELYASLDVMQTVLFSGPVTAVGLPIPNNPSLAGFLLYAQGAALVPTANPLGIATSNGLGITLGY